MVHPHPKSSKFCQTSTLLSSSSDPTCVSLIDIDRRLFVTDQGVFELAVLEMMFALDYRSALLRRGAFTLHRISQRTRHALSLQRRPVALYSVYTPKTQRYALCIARAAEEAFEEDPRDESMSGEWPMNWSLASYGVLHLTNCFHSLTPSAGSVRLLRRAVVEGGGEGCRWKLVK